MHAAYLLATFGLAPLLAAQGRGVRRRTPRLAEPAGPRSGEQGTGPALSLLLLGDSAAAGVGAATQAEALSGQLVAQLGTKFRVRWKLEARTGLAVSDLLETVERMGAQAFDVVLVSVGVNDVTGRTSTRQWRSSLARLVAALRERLGARHILLTGVPPMHLFPALPQPLRWYLGERARQLDLVLGEVAAADGASERLAPQQPLGRAAIAADGFHPGPPAYAAWASAAAAAIGARLEQAGIQSGSGANSAGSRRARAS
jgi:lysophospholipase L1-like esterase